MPDKITSLPEDDRVMRHVPWKKLLKDEDDNVLGFLGEAFNLRPDEEALSVNWIDFYSDPDPAIRLRDCVWEVRKARSVGRKSAFAIGHVRQIKEVCCAHGASVRIVHERKDGEPSHSGIRRLPKDDQKLLDALAADAFMQMVPDTDIPLQSVA